MANLEQIKKLNEIYDKQSPIRKIKTFAINANESINNRDLIKALDGISSELGPEYAQYFDLGLSADAVLMFIDVCSFSTRLSYLKGEEIGAYFDEYYEIIIPIIYKYGGEIDKIMGDGIVCLFAPPFQNMNLLFNIEQADKCAKEIIRQTKGTKYSSKVAFHSGEINYFKNKSGFYNELTVIGKPLTELFRLESISEDEQINYYCDTDIRKYYEDYRFGNNSSGIANWTHSYPKSHNLKGVGYTHYCSIEKLDND